jgi:PAS domain S-box-containing protein
METPAVSILPVLLAQAAGQILLAVVLAVVLRGFARVYGHSYLRHWALSWAALALYLALGLVVGVSDAGAARSSAPLAALALVAGHLQIAWLLLGAWGLARGADVPRQAVRAALAAAVVAGVVVLVSERLGVSEPSPLALRCLVAGVAYAACSAVLLLRAPAPRLGRRFAALALLLYAADQLAYFGVGFAAGPRQLRLLPVLMSVDLVATAVIGIALVTWLLEGEGERLLRAAELARQRGRAQECVYRISEAARTVRGLPELFRSIHDSLAEVLPARNFYISLLDRASGLLSFPYFADERDPTPQAKPPGRGLTDYVLRTGTPLLATPEVFDRLRARGEVEPLASDCVDWLGAPLFVHGEVIGVAAIQTYDPAVRLGPEQKDLFVFVSEQIASAIEARRTADALRQEEARLRLIVEQIPAVLWTTDEQLRFTTSVGSGLAALGLTPNQVVGMPVGEFLGPSGQASLVHHEEALKGASVTYEYETSGRFFVVHVEPLRDESGALRGTVGIAVDLTQQRQTDRALRDSEARLRQVINLVPHFIFAKDTEGRFLMVNRAVAEAYGTAVETLIGRTDAEFARSEEEARHFREDDLEVMRSGEPKVVGEEPITDAQGRVRWLQTTKIPFTFSGTGRPAVLGVSIDITERKAAEEALRRAAKEESLTVLAGGVAHDFNNLLAAILGHASLALKNMPPGSAARRHVEKAASAVERAADLTRQMLAYSGRGHFVVRSTDFNALVRENLPLLEVALPKSVELSARLGQDVPPVDADVGQIQQVLMNLVINAAEAIGPRGGTVTVATGVREVTAGDSELWRASGRPLAPGPYVRLEVSDDGPGIDAETVDRIFEPFFTTKFTGRGLGLAAVLGVVRGHRGALSVASAPGRGTVFRLLVPPGTGSTEELRPAEPGPGRRQSLRLLLVDDEEIVRVMVKEVLEAEGHQVLCAADGAAAIDLFGDRSRDVDVVLLDLSMPGLSGEETYACLCEIDPGVRVILSSGYDKDEATRRFGEKGPLGFIQKPYRPQDLLAEIERCLQRSAR